MMGMARRRRVAPLPILPCSRPWNNPGRIEYGKSDPVASRRPRNSLNRKGTRGLSAARQVLRFARPSRLSADYAGCRNCLRSLTVQSADRVAWERMMHPDRCGSGHPWFLTASCVSDALLASYERGSYLSCSSTPDSTSPEFTWNVSANDSTKSNASSPSSPKSR